MRGLFVNYLQHGIGVMNRDQVEDAAHREDLIARRHRPGLRVKVAAYQAPLLAPGSMQAIGLIRQQVERCEAQGVEILCCPEGILGGLADDCARPAGIALNIEGELDRALAPLASETVTTIVGFTETDRSGVLYNAAAIFHRGEVLGVYRKLHPAIRRSVYAAGDRTPVFTVGALTFGIAICRDSSFPEPAAAMVAGGATVLFVPTNNALPPGKVGPWIVTETRAADVARATETGMFVIRADVAGRTPELVAYGSSGVVDPDGAVRQSAQPFAEDLLLTEVYAQ